MKKKRYIKLLMSRGMSRNDARTYAEWVIWHNLQANQINRFGKSCGSEYRIDFLSYEVDYKSLLSAGGAV